MRAKLEKGTENDNDDDDDDDDEELAQLLNLPPSHSAASLHHHMASFSSTPSVAGAGEDLLADENIVHALNTPSQHHHCHPHHYQQQRSQRQPTAFAAAAVSASVNPSSSLKPRLYPASPIGYPSHIDQKMRKDEHVAVSLVRTRRGGKDDDDVDDLASAIEFAEAMFG